MAKGKNDDKNNNTKEDGVVIFVEGATENLTCSGGC